MENGAPKLLIIGLTWPEPEATAAGVRTLQIITFFRSLGYEITLCSAAARTTYSASFEKLDVATKAIKLNHKSFDQFITSLQPQLVVFDRFLTEEYFGWRVARCVPDAIRILDTQDLHSLRQSREIALNKKIPFEPALWKAQDITKRELASIFRSDLSLIISEFEMDWLQAHTPLDSSLLHYFPFLLEEAGITTTPDFVEFEERSDFVFIGNGRHKPNTDAIYFLNKEIWPNIRKAIPEAKLHIYGAYLPEKISALHQPKEGFYVEGWIKDAGKAMRNARINLIPLRYGAGLKGKLFQAIIRGTPSVMTQVGAEGTPISELHELIGTDPVDLANKAVMLYRDKELWSRMSREGLALFQTEFCIEDHTKQLQEKLEYLQNQLDEQRAQNLIGSMLLHHTMASSTYLSKWISLKQEKSEIQKK